MTTILARKVQDEIPVATDDEAASLLVADPTVTQFPSNTNSGYQGYSQYGSNQGPSFGSTNNINQSNSSTPVLTGAAPSNAATGADVLVKADEHWVNKHWRPAMGWLYMATCLFDFILFPILWSILQALTKGSVTMQWQPLTLQGAGLYHIAMGAVLGIAAYGRTREKMSGNT